MESNTKINPDKPTTSGTTTTGAGTTTGSAPQRAREQTSDVMQRGSEMYDQTRQAVSKAYDRTSETLSNTYDQAMTYGRDNPGKFALIAFGAGIGVGLLMAGGFASSRSRTARIAQPVINALSDIAIELFG